MREPHGAHAALAEQAVERVAADCLAFERRGRSRDAAMRSSRYPSLLELGVLRHELTGSVGGIA